VSDRLAVHGGGRVLDDSIKVKWPIITHEDRDAVMRALEGMERYVEGFHKVFGNIEQVLEVAADEVGEQVAGITVEE